MLRQLPAPGGSMREAEAETLRVLRGGSPAVPLLLLPAPLELQSKL